MRTRKLTHIFVALALGLTITLVLMHIMAAGIILGAPRLDNRARAIARADSSPSALPPDNPIVLSLSGVVSAAGTVISGTLPADAGLLISRFSSDPSGAGIDGIEPPILVGALMITADLSLSKTVNDFTPNIRDTITFTLTIANSGPDDATNVELSDPLPDTLTYVASSGGQDSYDSSTGLWTVGPVTSGTTISLTLVTKVTGPGQITNTAQITAVDQFDPDSTPGNNIESEDDQASVTLSSCGSPPHVLFVVKNPDELNPSDAAIRDRLTSMGYIVTVVDDNVAAAADADDKVLVLISESIASDKITTTFRAVTTPVLVWEGNIYHNMDMTASGSTDGDLSSDQTEINIVNPTHPLAAGLSDTVQVANTPTTMSFGQPNSNAITVAVGTAAGDSNKALIFGYDTGAEMFNGFVAPARRVGFFATENSAQFFTANGWALFDAAVDWASSSSGCDVKLQLRKFATPADTVLSNGTITYTIVVSNSGQAEATGVVVSDTLPANTNFVAGSISLNPPTAGTVGSEPPTLASEVTITAGQQITVSFAVIVNTALTVDTVITNTAAVTGFRATKASTDTITHTIVHRPDLSISKNSSPVPAIPGRTLTYTVVISNLGSFPSSGAVVSDTLPGVIQNPTWVCAASGGAGCTGSGSGDINEILTVPGGGIVTYTITGTLASSATAVVINTATVTTPLALADPITANNIAIDANTPVPQADLAINKRGEPDPVGAGTRLTYTLSITNNGPSLARVITVTDALPIEMTYIDAFGSGWSCNHLAGVVTCTRDELGVGAGPDITIVVTAPITGAILTNTASMSSTTLDPVASNSVTTTATTVVAQANLALSKVVTPGPLAPGQPLTYTLIYTNLGPHTAVGLVITDIVPLTLTNVSSTSSSLTITPTAGLTYAWQVADLASGAGGVITITGLISSELAGDAMLTNRATITTKASTITVDSNPANNSDVVTTSLRLPRVSFSRANYTVPEHLGPALITVTLDIPPFTSPSIAYTTRDGTAISTEDYVTTTGSLIFPTGTTILTFTVPITDDTLNEGNETVELALSNPAGVLPIAPVTATLTIIDNDALPLLSIQKRAIDANGPPLEPTDIITYTIVVTNSGDSPATGVVISDALPTHTNFVSGSITLEPAGTGTVGTKPPILAHNLTISPDKRITVTFAVTVTSPLTTGTVITNTAAVSSTGLPALTTGPVTNSVMATPRIRIDKTGPQTATVGSTLVFNFLVTNIGNTRLQSVTVEDSLAGPAAFVGGDNGDGWLDLTETWLYTVAYTAAPTLTNLLVNTGSVTATDPLGVQITATDRHTTTLFGFVPILAITQVSPALANVGETIGFTFTVSHATGSDQTPISNVSVENTVAGPATRITGGDDLLEGDEEWVYTASYTVKPIDPNPLVNTSTIEGRDPENDIIRATTTHSTRLQGFEPVMMVFIDPDPVAAKVNDTVVFTFTVINVNPQSMCSPSFISTASLGDGSPVIITSVVDSVAGQGTYVAGDLDANGKVDADECWIYTAMHTIAAGDPDPLVHEVIVQALDSENEVHLARDDSSTDILPDFSEIIYLPILLKQ